MKKLTVEEAKDLKPAGAGNTSKISAMAADLKTGEALIITRADWKHQKTPYRIINYLEKKSGKKFERGRLPDGSGWLIKRVG